MRKVINRTVENDDDDDNDVDSENDSSTNSSKGDNDASENSTSDDDDDDSNDDNNNNNNVQDEDVTNDDDGGTIKEETIIRKNTTSEQQQAQQQQQQQQTPTNTAVVLSKSWSILSSHVPTYTGGKIATIPLKNDTSNGMILLTPVHGDISIVNSLTGTRIGTIRRGIISSSKNAGSISSTTGGNNDNDSDDDDDDDSFDVDAITAFGVFSSSKSTNDSNNTKKVVIVITCSRNMILRQYSLTIQENLSSDGDDNNSDDDNDDASTDSQDNNIDTGINQPIISIELTKTWGKCGHTLPVTDIQFHKSGVFVATSSVDGTVKIWDVRGRYATHVYRPLAKSNTANEGVRSSVTCIRWFPTKNQLLIAIGREDGSICIHNLQSSDLANVVVLNDHVSAVTCIEWNIQSNHMVSTGRDQVVNLWKFHEINNDEKQSKKKNKSKNKKAHQSDGEPSTTIVTVHSYKKIKTVPLYEQIEGLVIIQSLNRNNDDDEFIIATAGTKGQVRVWKFSDPNSGLQLYSEQSIVDSFGEKRGGYIHLQQLITNTDNQPYLRLLVADNEHNIAFLAIHDDYDTDKMEQDNESRIVGIQTERTIVGHNDEILDIKLLPRPQLSTIQNKIVVVTNSSQVKIFDTQTFSCVAVLDHHTATCLSVDVSPCGTFITTCGKDKTACVWTYTENNNTTRLLAIASGHTEAIGSVAFSRKSNRYEIKGKAANNGGGSFIVTVSMDRTIKRWNLPGSDDLLSDQQSKPIELTAFISTRAHEKDINIVTVAPNDSLIATGSQDKSVKLWKATDLSLVATLRGHKRGVWDCQFSTTDRVLATSSGDKSIKLWSLHDYNCVRTFQGHVSSVLRVRFLSAGLQLVSSGADGLLKLWTIRTNEAEATLDVHNDKIWAMDISTDGKQLISGGADSQIIVWKDTTKEIQEAKHAEEEEAILLDQKLANHIRRKEYGEALDISIDRDKPHHALKVLNSIIEASTDTTTLSKAQQQAAGINVALMEITKYQHVWKESNDRLLRLLRYCRDWNTKARNCHVAMLTLKAIVTTIPVQQLATTDGVPEILAGIVVYSERHLDRIDRLHESSYLLDFALSSMGVITDDEADDNTYETWEAQSKYVLPPKRIDGKVDVGGNVVVGAPTKFNHGDSDNDMEEVLVVGDSDSDDE